MDTSPSCRVDTPQLPSRASTSRDRVTWRWKVETPLPGFNSPVVWNNRLFLSGATEEAREVYCYDTELGDLLWKQALPRFPGTPVPPPEPARLPREPITWDRIWQTLLSERTLNVLLFLGAFLMLASAITYVVYNWENLPPAAQLAAIVGQVGGVELQVVGPRDLGQRRQAAAELEDDAVVAGVMGRADVDEARGRRRGLDGE